VDKEISFYKEIGLIPGVRSLLIRIKRSGVKTGLATSASRKRMYAVLDMFDLANLFDECVCDNEVLKSKPDPEIFLLAAQKLEVHPKMCVVIEDSKNGLLSAKAAGMKCVAYRGLNHIIEDMTGADMEVSDFTKLTLSNLKKLFVQSAKTSN
jgi:beta-phosphoglucomutase